MPSGIEFAASIPRTSVGKFNKRALRDEYRDYFLSTPVLPSESTSTSPTITT
jgi:acyl-CoA synthetase (AMP-forming)/AMP-acid ligase II